jgi:hypothetical protein
MVRPQDAPALAALESQSRELTIVLGRLETARSTLIPSSATFWQGAARHAYDAAIEGVVRTVDLGIAAVRAARDHTNAAIAGLAARG